MTRRWWRGGVALVAAATVAHSLPAWADGSGEAEIRAFDAAPSFELGVTHFNYAETIDGTKFDTERAWLPTLALGGGWLGADGARDPWSNLYLHADLALSGGTASYDGALCGITTCTPLNTDDDMGQVELALQAGHAFVAGPRAMLIPFGELDFRYWYRDLQGAGATTERYSNWAGLAGLKVQYSPAPHWVWSVSAAAGPTFGADMTTGGVDFPLGGSIVVRGQARLGLRLTDRLTATGTLGYEHLTYGQSPTTFAGFCAGLGGCFEPHSTTEQVSATTGLAYRF